MNPQATKFIDRYLFSFRISFARPKSRHHCNWPLGLGCESGIQRRSLRWILRSIGRRLLRRTIRLGLGCESGFKSADFDGHNEVLVVG